METLAFIMDIILLIGGLLGMYYAKTVGGSIGRGSLTIMAVGFLVLGFAHLSETALFQIFSTADAAILEVTHRVIVLAALAFILLGYGRLAKFVRS